MAKVRQTNTANPSKKLRPALTMEARENQMISLAMDLVEQRMLDGTASSQETTHFLKLGSSKYKLEAEKLREENALLRAKTSAIESQKKTEEMFAEAIAAFRDYSGNSSGDNDDY